MTVKASIFLKSLVKSKKISIEAKKINGLENLVHNTRAHNRPYSIWRLKGTLSFGHNARKYIKIKNDALRMVPSMSTSNDPLTEKGLTEYNKDARNAIARAFFAPLKNCSDSK